MEEGMGGRVEMFLQAEIERRERWGGIERREWLGQTLFDLTSFLLSLFLLPSSIFLSLVPPSSSLILHLLSFLLFPS